MGLFSSKKKKYVNTTVQRIVDDNLLPESIKSGMIKAIFNDGSIPEYVLEEFNQSIALRAQRMYEYAKRNNYVFGIPTGGIKVAYQGASAVQEFLERLEGRPVSLEYYHFAPINALHAGWYALTKDYGYDAATNEITVLSQQIGFPVYLKDMLPVYTTSTVAEAEDVVMESWGPNPRNGPIPGQRVSGLGQIGMLSDPVYDVDPSATEDRVRVEYTFKNSEGWVTQTLMLSLSQYGDDDEFHQVRYRAGGRLKFWLYQAGLGEYPEIDALHEVDFTQFGSYMPFVYLRMADSKLSTEDQASSAKLCKYLGMDYYDLLDAVYANDGISDVEQAFVLMAVPANTSTFVEQKYLFEYFNAVVVVEGEYLPPPPKTEYDAEGNAYIPEVTPRSIRIADKKFTMTLSYTRLDKVRRIGKLSNGAEYASRREGNDYYYSRQVSNTVFEEIQITDLKMTYHIRGRYHHTGSGADEELLIPVDMGTLGYFPLKEREALLSRSLHLVFNTYQEVKVKWYQQGWFRVFLVVVAVVLTIYSMGASGGLFASLAAAGSLTAVAWIMVVAITKMVLVHYGIKLFIKEVGEKWAIVASIAAIAAAIYFGGDSSLAAETSSSVATTTTEISFQNFLVEVSRMSANEMLGAATNLFNSAVTGLQQAMFEDLQMQYANFEKEKNAANERLKAAQDLLGIGNDLLDPFMFTSLQPRVVWGETPDDFYSRTVHSGNIGVMGIDMVSSFVDTALQLPRIHTSLGDI